MRNHSTYHNGDFNPRPDLASANRRTCSRIRFVPFPGVVGVSQEPPRRRRFYCRSRAIARHRSVWYVAPHACVILGRAHCRFAGRWQRPHPTRAPKELSASTKDKSGYALVRPLPDTVGGVTSAKDGLASTVAAIYSIRGLARKDDEPRWHLSHPRISLVDTEPRNRLRSYDPLRGPQQQEAGKRITPGKVLSIPRITNDLYRMRCWQATGIPVSLTSIFLPPRTAFQTQQDGRSSLGKLSSFTTFTLDDPRK